MASAESTTVTRSTTIAPVRLETILESIQKRYHDSRVMLTFNTYRTKVTFTDKSRRPVSITQPSIPIDAASAASKRLTAAVYAIETGETRGRTRRLDHAKSRFIGEGGKSGD